MKYKVLKDFLDESGVLHLKGNETELPQSYFVGSLKANNFIEEIKDGPWEPKAGEQYFLIDDTGGIQSIEGDTSGWVDERISIGNCFQTKEQAEKAVAWLKAFKILRDDTKGFKPDWKNHQKVFYVQYDHHDVHDLEVDYDFDLHWGIIYFATRADAEESIKNHRQEWLTFFGVESE